MKKMLWITCCLLLFTCGCFSPMPVASIDNAKITLRSDRSMADVIRAAALQKGWVAKEIKDGVVRCTLNVRTHQVVVDVTYVKDTISIDYVSSENMKYDPVKKTINRKYIQWVRNLYHQIEVEASR